MEEKKKIDKTTELLREALAQLTEEKSSSSASAPTQASLEFRQRFPGMCSTTVSRPPLKKPKLSGYVPAGKAFLPKDTWTHEFCVLSGRDEELTPSRERLVTLTDAGLGKAKVTIPKMASHEDLQAELIKKFPKLKDAGGFEVLRASGSGGGQRQLILIRPGAFGYTAPYLKDRMGQAIAYIRPLQRNLSDEKQVIQNFMTPKVDCVNCGMGIPMAQMRAHQLQCGGGSSSGTTGRGDDCSPPPSYDIESGEDSGHDKELSIVGISSNSSKGSESNKAPEEDVICVESKSSTNVSEAEPKIKESEWYITRTEVLSNIFPNIPEREIKEVVDVALDMDDAVNMLLDEPYKETPLFVEKETVEKAPLNLKTLMKSHRIQLSEEETNRTTIERDNLWCESIIFFKSPKFKPRFPLRVRFSGEAGLDAGGLSREYSRLLQQAIFSTDASLFEGRADRRLPIYSGDALHSNLFVLAGKMCAYLISHYDIGIPCLAPCAYSYISTGDIAKASQKCSLEDMPDLDLQEQIKEVNDAITKDELANALSPTFSSALQSAGWVKVLTLENKGLAMWQLIVHETLLKRKAPLDHFIKGLHLLNLLPMIRSHPELMSCYFLPMAEKLNKESIISLFKNLKEVQDDKDSERARGFLHNAIEDLEKDQGEKGLQNFLKFITGLEQVPPLGFSSPVTIEFNGDGGPTFFAETCLLVLKLPTMHREYESFKSQFMIACNIGNAGFGSI